METDATLNKVQRPTTLALIMGAPVSNPTALEEIVSETNSPAQAETQAAREDSANFQTEMLRRREAPFELSWRHGGLNE